MLSTIKTIITSYFYDVWPIVTIITVISCSLRIAYLIKNKQKFCFYKDIAILMFILYVMCLFEVVTLQDNNYGLSNYIPFAEIFRYQLGSRLFIKNIVCNILLFIPYGYFSADYLKTQKIWVISLLTALVSITIECVQLNIGRTFDIDDIILNTLGGLVGCILYALIEKIKIKLPNFFKTDGFINFIVILLFIISLFYLFDWPLIKWIN